MAKFKIWQVGETVPLKLAESNVGLEKNLEDWIESDPTFLPGELEIICRQLTVEGGRLDLLALDPLGRYVVIEVKAGPLYSDVISQGIYYAAQIDGYSFDTLEAKVHYYLAKHNKDLKKLLQNRGLAEKDYGKEKEILIYVVGTQSASGINKMLDYMGRKFHAPLTAVTFDVYQLENGNRILVRDITEADVPVFKAYGSKKKNTFSLDNICEQADKKGVGSEFRLILEVANSLGFYPRLYSHSIMYTHPDHKNRMLFTVWTNRKPLSAYVGYEAFTEYYPLTTEQVAEALGPSGGRTLDIEQAKLLVSGLEKLVTDKVLEK